MKTSLIFSLISLGVLLYSCGEGNKREEILATKDSTLQDTINHISFDSLHKGKTDIPESYNEEDVAGNELMAARLKPVRDNFKRINSTLSWTKIDSIDLQETTEGGEAKFYYQGSRLEKLVTRHYGETFQKLTEYYLLNGQLSFVFERSYSYNRPSYYDSAAMKQYNDTEAFSLDKSKIVEDRSYFEKDKLIHQLNNEDCGSPFSNEYLQEEQKRLQSDFRELIKMKKN